ncbi:MAG: hypothetical protein M0006_08515 [Magnetospirillum sp.]|nr:hypothetical protein [Magnetospirillum sp.]
MQTHDKKRERLVQAKIDADRKMAEIFAAFAPEGKIIGSPDELKACLAARLTAAGPEERKALRVRMALALADLDGLRGMLDEHLDVIRQELRTMKDHRGASAAYGRAAVPHRAQGY